MTAIDPVWWFVTGIWGLVWVALIVRTYRANRGCLAPRHGLAIGGMALLGIAPLVSLFGYFMSGGNAFAGLVQVVIAMLLFAASRNAARYEDEGKASEWSFGEKSALLVAVSNIVVFGSYFLLAWGSPFGEAMVMLGGAVVSFIVVLIVGHIVISILHVPIGEIDTPVDERDVTVKLLATRIAYGALLLGLWALPVVYVFELSALTLVNTWFGLLVLAEVVRSSAMVAYYRGVLAA